MAVDWADDHSTVTWHSFQVEDGSSDQDDMVDLVALDPFVFKAEPYRRVLLEAADMLVGLAARERVVGQRYRAER